MTTAVAWALALVGEVDVVDASLVLALTVVVPYGLHLVVPSPRWADDLVARQSPADLALLGTVTVLLAGALPPYSSVLVLAFWFVPVVGLGVATLRQFGWRPGRRHDWGVEEWSTLVAFAWLAVGAGWLVLHHAGIEPFGFREPLVELTAVHFHYAGFASTVVAREVWRHVRPTRPRAGMAALLLTAGAPPVVAVGFQAVPVLQVVGALLLTAGLWTAAVLVLRVVAPDVPDRPAASLLAVSSLAVFVPMVLAVQWAAGHVYGTPALSIPDMAVFHGTTNALGFALLGLVGWRRLEAVRPPGRGSG